MSEEALKPESDIAAVSCSSTSTPNQTFETAEEVEFNPNPALKSSAENASSECMKEHDFTRQKKRIRFCPIVLEKQYIISKAPIDTVSGMEETKLLKDAEGQIFGKPPLQLLIQIFLTVALKQYLLHSLIALA